MKAGVRNLLGDEESCTGCGMPLLVARVDENGDPKGFKFCPTCEDKLRRKRAEQRKGAKTHDGCLNFRTLRYVQGGSR